MDDSSISSPSSWANPDRALITNESPLRAARILAVDDDNSARHFYKVVLDEAGYRVDCAADGDQAWVELLERPYDLLLTDHQMPGLSGLELAARARQARAELPIVVCTGAAESDLDLQHPQLTNVSILRKPCPLVELLEVVHALLPAALRRGGGLGSGLVPLGSPLIRS